MRKFHAAVLAAVPVVSSAFLPAHAALDFTEFTSQVQVEDVGAAILGVYAAGITMMLMWVGAKKLYRSVSAL
jgi:uncharacterized glyoxalase superfamily metalloenzyme YdcJ